MRRYIAVVLVWCAPFLAPAGASAQEVIYLIRHAEQGPPPELVLTEAGHRRAAALSHRLKDARINAVFVTNAARTQQTAAPIARALIGKEVGESIEVNAPGGARGYEIVKVQFV